MASFPIRAHARVRSLGRAIGRGDGAVAVVDVDTVWRSRVDGTLMEWKERACKGFTRVGDDWLLIFHTGSLDYDRP